MIGVSDFKISNGMPAVLDPLTLYPKSWTKFINDGALDSTMRRLALVTVFDISFKIRISVVGKNIYIPHIIDIPIWKGLDFCSVKNRIN